MVRDNNYDIRHTYFGLVKVTVPVPQQSKLPQFEGKWAMRMSPEMLIMFAQCDHRTKFNSQSPFLVSNPLQLCSVQDSLPSIAVEVRREGQGSSIFSIIEKKQVGLR